MNWSATKMEDMNDNHICPRCSGGIPNNIDIGKYCGAISRLDNKTEICSSCGQDEATEDYFQGGVKDWRKSEYQQMLEKVIAGVRESLASLEAELAEYESSNQKVSK